MLNQIDERRLSKKLNVKFQCHGGCTIRCMYTHLPNIVQAKPDFLLFHIGTNDATSKTSDVILKELDKLIEDVSLLLPSTKIIISTPIMRFDDKRANTIIKNLNLKLKQLKYHLLDNFNITFSHLGKKGLHLNLFGTKLIARNIISLIKQL